MKVVMLQGKFFSKYSFTGFMKILSLWIK